jgi:hypothetical protein
LNHIVRNPILFYLLEVKMNTAGVRNHNLSLLSNPLRIQRGLLFGALIILALLAFEIFNYSTTDFALTDLLGNLSFVGIRWATILAIAFCGIDFAGIARLFTPDNSAEAHSEIWYLFGAWMLAATMNAMLTWWGVSIAILNHETLGNAVVDRQTLLRVVPIFVAIMVWLIRVLIIGTFSVAGDRLFEQSSTRMSIPAARNRSMRAPENERLPAAARSAMTPASAGHRSFRPAPKVSEPSEVGGYARPEPTYHPATMSSIRNGDRSNVRRL